MALYESVDFDGEDVPFCEIESDEDGENLGAGNSQHVSNDAGPPSSEIGEVNIDRTQAINDDIDNVTKNLAIATIFVFGASVILYLYETTVKPASTYEKMQRIQGKLKDASNLFGRVIQAFYFNK